jgi:alpha-galactosidase
VTFTVAGDGRTLAETGVVSGGQVAVAVDAGVTGVTELMLRTGPGPDGDKDYDHSEWVDAKATCG